MPQINYNRDLASANTLEKISQSTGLDNLTKSSKTRLISEAVSSDISTFIGAANLIRDNMYPETASGRHLDAEGAQHGTYRMSMRDLYIRSTDLVVKIEPRDPGSTFADLLRESHVIYAGESIVLNNGLIAMITDDVMISPSSDDVYLSIKLSNTNLNEGYSVAKNDVFKVIGTFRDISSLQTMLQIRFNRDISMQMGRQEDSEFRTAVLTARDFPTIALDGAIRSAVLTSPGVSGCAVYNKARGSSTIDVLVATEEMMTPDLPTSIPTEVVRGMVEYRLRGVVSGGVTCRVLTPKPLGLVLEYIHTSESEISEESIASAVYNAFHKNYRFSEVNMLLSADLESSVMLDFQELSDFTILNMSLFDPVLEENIVMGGSRAITPKGYYMTISKEDIHRVE